MSFRQVRPTAFVPRLPRRLPAVLVTALAWLSLASPVAALDLDIRNEADYRATLDGIRAAEYVRQRYLEGADVPRALVVSTGLWVFAERNPLASESQLAEFTARFDARLRDLLAGDPDLDSNGAIPIALGKARVPATGRLEGTDTRVGQRARALLGMDIPGVENLLQSIQRMSHFDRASVRRLIQRRETADMLTALLAGRTPGGRAHDGLAQTAAAYLASQGLDPVLGAVDPDMPFVDQGLADLPTWAEFVALQNTPGAHQALEQEIFLDIDVIQRQSAALLEDIGMPVPAPGELLEAFERTRSAADPDDAGHEAALALIEASRAAVVQSIRAVAAQRSAVFARTLLLQQSRFPEVQLVATSARDYTALQLQTNNSLAVAGQGAGIVGSLVGAGVGFKTGDTWGAVQSLTDVVAGALGLADLFGAAGPSADAQIFDQIVALRQQVEDLRVRMERRFTVIDRKLDQVFETMVGGFARLDAGIDALQRDVDALSANIAEARSSLDRIEDALFGMTQELLVNELFQEFNKALKFNENNGISLPYAEASTNFVDSSSFFYTFATSTSKGASFAGTPDDQPVVLSVDNAASTLDDSAISRRLNDLRRVPDGLPVNGPLVAGRVPAPAPWAQGATAYLQLAEENPWFFNYQFASQAAGGGATRIDEIIRDGERITGLADAVRSNAVLFDALLGRARDGAAALQVALLDWIDAALPARYRSADGSLALDPWGPLVQNMSALSPVLTFNLSDPSGRSAGFSNSVYGNLPLRGWEMVVGPALSTAYPPGTTRSDVAERHALQYLLEVSDDRFPDVAVFVEDGTISPVFNPTGFSEFRVFLSVDGDSPYKTTRVLDFRIEVFFPFLGWQRIGNSVFPFFQYYIDQFRTAFGSGLDAALDDAQLVGQAFLSGTLQFAGSNGDPVPLPTRIVAIGDETYPASRSDLQASTFDAQTQFLAGALGGLRRSLRGRLLTEFDPGPPAPPAALAAALNRLDNDSALLDAYLTIGMADALDRSEILRSGVRGAPGVAGLGFDRGNIEQIVAYANLNDTGTVGGIPGLGLPSLGATLEARIEALSYEIGIASRTSAPSFPYVELILSELKALRTQAASLAIGDTFIVAEGGTLDVPAASGLLRNDISQAGAVDSQLVVDQAFLASPGALRPSQGDLVVRPDGSFRYVARPGASGIDRFTYRLRAPVGAAGEPNPDAFSDPTTVVLRIGKAVVPSLIFRDSFE